MLEDISAACNTSYFKKDYAYAQTLNLAPADSWHDYGDWNPLVKQHVADMYWFMNGETYENPIEYFFNYYIGYNQQEGAFSDRGALEGQAYKNSTRTRLFSQLVYEAERHIRYGGLVVEDPTGYHYKYRSNSTSERESTMSDRLSYIPISNSIVEKTISALRLITPTEGSSSFPSDSDISSFFDELPSGTDNSIISIPVALAKDYMQSIGLNTKDFYEGSVGAGASIYGIGFYLSNLAG